MNEEKYYKCVKCHNILSISIFGTIYFCDCGGDVVMVNRD